MTVSGESFWSVVSEPFMARDITRDDLRAVISKGLEETRGSYKQFLPLFNIAAEDYKRLLSFLRKYGLSPAVPTISNCRCSVGLPVIPSRADGFADRARGTEVVGITVVVKDVLLFIEHFKVSCIVIPTDNASLIKSEQLVIDTVVQVGFSSHLIFTRP